MWIYKGVKYLCRGKQGELKDGEVPKYDSNGKPISITYFQDGWDWLLKGLTITANLLAGGSIGLFAWLLFKLADTLFDSAGGTWQLWIVYMALDCVLLGVLLTLGTFFAEWSAERQLLKIRQRFLKEVMRQDISYFDGYDATALASKLMMNTRLVRDLIGIRTSMAYMYIGVIVALLEVAFQNQAGVAGVSLCVLPVIVLSGWWAGRIEYKATLKVKESNETANSVALEAITNMRTVKAFNMQDTMKARYGVCADIAENVVNKASVKTGFGYGFYWLCIFCASAFGYWYGSHVLYEASMKFCEDVEICEEPAAIVGAYISVIWTAFYIGKVIPWISDVQQGNLAVRETVALYDRRSLVDPYNPDGITDLSNVQGEIKLENVAFAYPTRSDVPVFSRLNLTIPAGKSIALVGASGCGKSTVIQLVMRFYDPQSGLVMLDGRPLTEYNVKALRETIAWVGQEPKLFASSIAENIAIGKPDATREEIEEVARKANAHEFISALPDGYDTWVGDGGNQLSGGQKQRVAIARALIKRPKILILDEATSALDNKSEQMVQETLDDIVSKSQITTIIIAHRLTTVRNADVIAVLNNPTDRHSNSGDGGGQELEEMTGSSVVELGTHEELSKIPDGIYAALVAIQTEGPTEEDETDRALQASGGQGAYDYSPQESAILVGGILSRQMSKQNSKSYHQNSKLRQNSKLHQNSRTGGSFEMRTQLSKQLGDVARQESLVFTADYKPPRLFRRTAAPIKSKMVQHILGVVCYIAYQCIWPIYGACYGTFLKTFVDAENPDRLKRESRNNTIIMLCIGIGSFVTFWGQRWFVSQSGQAVVRQAREGVFGGIMKQEMGFFDQPHRSPARLGHILGADTFLLGEWTAGNTTMWLGVSASLILGLVLCLQVNLKLGGVALAIIAALVPITYVASTLVTTGGSIRLTKGEDKLTRTMGDMSAYVTSVILNIRTVTAYNMQPQCEAEFDEMVNILLKEGRKRALIGSIAIGTSNMLRLAAFTLLFYYGATLMANEGLNAVDMMRGCMSFLLAGLQVGRSLAGNVPYSLGKNAARNVWTVVDRLPQIDEDNSMDPTPGAIEEVKFSNVAFKYPTRPNLPIYRNISFSVPRGKSVALVGASGCGKSTAVQLVERFYDVFTKEGQSFGKITINGVDIRDYYVKGLRSRIGLVSQEPSLFSGSVRDNILYGNPEASEEDIIEACREANAWGFVQDMPEGLNTEVGRGGSRLSGGQKQRIAIARALVKKPELLILDEATSALDAASEKVVQEALNKLLATKKFNALVIAHRLSTIRDCDYIVVFVNHNTRGSQIAEVGNHQQLMAIKDGVYSKLVRIAEGASH